MYRRVRLTVRLGLIRFAFVGCGKECKQFVRADVVEQFEGVVLLAFQRMLRVVPKTMDKSPLVVDSLLGLMPLALAGRLG